MSISLIDYTIMRGGGVIVLFLFLSFKSGGQTSCNPSINITHAPFSLCRGLTPSFTATAFSAGSNPVYQWKKNGIPVGTNSPSYSGALAINDRVVCELTTTSCGSNSTVISNSFTLQTFFEPTPEVTSVASQQLICAGGIVTFNATNRSGSTNESYQWIVNGNRVNGTNSTVFATAIITDSTVIECIMTTSMCLMSGGSTKDYSDPIVIRIPKPLKPSVTITTNTALVCENSAVSFKATAVDAGTNPTYSWKINGTSVLNTGAVLVTSTLKSDDKVSCEITTDPSANCSVLATATSNILTMEVKQSLSPQINIVSSAQEICAGMPVIFTADTSGAGSNSSFEWMVNAQKAGKSGLVYNTTNLKNGDQITGILSTTSGCNNSLINSNVVNMIVNPAPDIKIDTDSLTIWAGEQATLNASVSGNLSSYAWSPTNQLSSSSLSTLTTPLHKNTNFILSAVSDKGCTATASVEVKVYHQLYIPNSFSPNGDGINDVFRIPEGIPLALKEFSIFDRWGNRVFSTSNTSQGWNGNIKSALANTGMYVYVLRGHYQNQDINLKGFVVLIR